MSHAPTQFSGKMEDHPKFAKFDVSTTPYKVVNGQEIPLWVLIPKDSHTGPRPIIIHLHGGFLVTGHALFPDWAAQWSLDYTTLHSAIRISANYRLLPESNGPEILSDLRDLLTWVETSLPKYLTTLSPTAPAVPDLSRVAIYGESAGGYLALQAALLRPDLIRACIAAYPMTDLASPWYSAPATETYIKSPFGAPQTPRSVIDNHLAAIAADPGKIFTGAFPNARMDIALSLLQNGVFPAVMGTDDSIFPFKVLASKTGQEKMPHLYLFHGTEDSAVPVGDSIEFVKAWKAKFGDDSAVAKFESGEHGLDGEATLETPWMKEGLEGVTKAWIG